MIWHILVMKTSHEIKNTAEYKGFKAFYRGSNPLCSIFLIPHDIARKHAISWVFAFLGMTFYKL